MRFSASSAFMYALPLLALIPRSWLVWRFRKFMSEELSESEKAAGEHRAYISTLAAYSFTAAIGVPAYGATTGKDVLLSTFYAVTSFLCYLGALHIQSYKFSRFRDQFGSAMVDAATLSLVFAVLAMVASLQPPFLYLFTLVGLTICIWGTDAILRLRYSSSFLREKEVESNGSNQAHS